MIGDATLPRPSSGAGPAPASEADARFAGRAPIVSVIIPHYNDLANLKLCLGLLAQQTAPREDFEVVVADNNSACGLEAVAAVCGDIARAVPAPIQGAGPARNAAVRHAHGRYLAFTDSDCLPVREWVANGIRAMRTWWEAASMSSSPTGDVRRRRKPSKSFSLSIYPDQPRSRKSLGEIIRKLSVTESQNSAHLSGT
jgi:glycosyltransferase involved in cell wall biosynthesis